MRSSSPIRPLTAATTPRPNLLSSTGRPTPFAESRRTEPLETRSRPEMAPYIDVAMASCNDSGTRPPMKRVAPNARLLTA